MNTNRRIRICTTMEDAYSRNYFEWDFDTEAEALEFLSAYITKNAVTVHSLALKHLPAEVSA